MTTSPSPIAIPLSLQPTHTQRAIDRLATYFAPMHDGGRFTGGQWDGFDPSGQREATQNAFVSDDLVACALLSAPIGSAAAYELLMGTTRNQMSELLRQIPTDKDFVRITPGDTTWQTMEDTWQTMEELYQLLRGIHGLGMTRVTKLMARKRPLLVPIIDQVVASTVFPRQTRFWVPLHQALTAHDNELHNHLRTLHTAAALPAEVNRPGMSGE